MDRKPLTTRRAKYPGIRIRRHKGGLETIQIAFSFQGRECRETSPRPESTEENLEWSARLRELILQEIELGTFDYKRHFHEAKRAREIGRTEKNPVMRDLFDDFLADSDGLYPSTLHGYKKIIEGHLKPRFGSLTVREVTPQALRRFIKDLTRKTK